MRGPVALLLFASLAGSTGCIAWHSGTAMPDTHTALTEQRSKIFLDLNYETAVSSADSKLIAKTTPIIAEKITGYARDVFDERKTWATSREEADYVLKVEVVDRGEPNTALAVLSGVTLLVIPGWAVDNYSVDAELTSKDGRKLGTRSLQESETTLFEVLFLLGMPFAGPWYATKSLWHEVFGDLASWTDTMISGPHPGSGQQQAGTVSKADAPPK